MSNRNDVAKRAGVSPAVVSYVLNNSNYVSAEKREAVLRAVEELNYHPNYTARSLKEKKTRHFAMITNDIRNEIYSEITYHMELMAYEQGYNLAVSSCNFKKAKNFMDTLLSRQYDGIFLASNVYSVEQLNELAKSRIPLVLFQYRNYENLHPKVTVMSPRMLEAVTEAVDYLVEDRGHKVIGYLGDGNPVLAGEKGPCGEGLRVNGYINSLRKHGLELKKQHVYFLEEFQEPDSHWLDVSKIIDDYLATSPGDRPTAYFSGTDMMAAKLVAEFHARGIRVPRDVEIIGCGNTHSAFICSPPLTTIALPLKDIADKVVEALILKSEGKEAPNNQFDLKFIKRDTA